eukprot:GEMP01007110.1.p1 GENE.GEMP01007110.1~~GEMP01007110.1.p1  ORF type:complete len:635 (-),score=124.56 GEMP01007110.1:1638-3542(-)
MNCFSFLQRQLYITTPLLGAGERQSLEERTCISAHPWRAFCPNCSRPIDVSLRKKRLPTAVKNPRHAYVIAIWGHSPTYILGALVLGQSLRQSGTTKDMVVLYTDDVQHIELLEQVGWQPILMEDVESTAALFGGDRGRFDRVFNKLRALSLTQYSKVCMMDIDMLALENIDDIFDLPAPAAMRRNHAKINYPEKHGELLDGTYFFFGSDRYGENVQLHERWKSWAQSGGINAGIMVLEPNQQVLNNMLVEVKDPNHPSHVPGSGPEQDYLTRYYADRWRNVAVEYNYQLHQLFFGLHPARVKEAVRTNLCVQGIDKLKIIHFSGSEDMKPWFYPINQARAESDKKMSFDEFVEFILAKYHGYLLWVKKDRTMWDGMMSYNHHDVDGLKLSRDGKILWTSSGMEAVVPKETGDAAVKLVWDSIDRWMDVYREVEKMIGTDLIDILYAKATKDSYDQYNDQYDDQLTDTVPSTNDSSKEMQKAPSIVAKAYPVWTTRGSWYGVQTAAQDKDVYRIMATVDDHEIKIFTPSGIRRSNASIFIYEVPEEPKAVDVHELSHILDADPQKYFVIALRKPDKATLAVLNLFSIGYPAEANVVDAYFACHGSRATGWECHFDEQLAFIAMHLCIPSSDNCI